MEIKFENKNVSMYREISRQTKKVQESAESVVPDTDDDIGRIATVQSYVMLKSKDITSRGVLISGEAVASLLYITESQESMSFVRLSKSFSVEYEVPEIESDAAAQIKLSILSTEARVINPRKVSVTFEISGELSCYKQESISIESRLPENACRGLHARYESAELMFTDAVCEKTFAVNEQFAFPGGKPKPSRLVSGRAEFVVSDSQLIGTKVIVKGSAELAVCYLSDEVNYPVRTEFCTPFSQIIDIGEECMDSCCVSIELTGAYFDIIDTVNGDKALDAELHAVMQLVCRSRKRIRVGGAYLAGADEDKRGGECRRRVPQHTGTACGGAAQHRHGGRGERRHEDQLGALDGCLPASRRAVCRRAHGAGAELRLCRQRRGQESGLDRARRGERLRPFAVPGGHARQSRG